MTSPTSRDLLAAQLEAEIIKRSRRLDEVVMLDLDDRGLDDEHIDYETTCRKMHVNDDETEILGWTWTVNLKSGEQIVYTMDNSDDAPIYCGEGSDRVELVFEEE